MGGERMELSELAAYAKEKYQIQEEHKWTAFPGFSVLSHPGTGQWLALLMRQWDPDLGEEIQRCDIKCGMESLRGFHRSYLSAPLRMQGQKWIGVAFADETEPEVVKQLFDRAYYSVEQRGFTIVLDEPKPQEAETVYRDTRLSFSGNRDRFGTEAVPERIRALQRMYEYDLGSFDRKAAVFYRQGKFMENYEDEYPWKGDFLCYFPTYQDLKAGQLRGYFSWRTHARRGEFLPLPTSAVYLYVYELLNGIGVSSPEESIEKLKALMEGFPNPGAGVTANLRRWMLEFIVLWGLPPETALEYVDPGKQREDMAFAVLKAPGDHTDEEVFEALDIFGKKLSESPVVKGDAERGKHLFSEAWRTAKSCYEDRGRDLFALCFGAQAVRRWHPLANAVYRRTGTPEDKEYVLNPARVFTCRGGVWFVRAYDRLLFDRDRFEGFLHETERQLRLYLKAGRSLRRKPEEDWAAPFAAMVIEEDRKRMIEASRPKITIDLSGLEQIRKDAVTTRDSLLLEEERAGIEEEPFDAKEGSTSVDKGSISVDKGLISVVKETPQERAESIGSALDIPLSEVQQRVLALLLRGESPQDLLKAGRLMPSLVADELNEALFDEIGDIVVLCEEDELSLVEDYREELFKILGGYELE